MKHSLAPTGTAALDKGLILLERILADRGRTPLPDLAQDMGLPRSTLHRLVGALERHGLVARIGRGRFDAGLPLVEALLPGSIPGFLARASRPALLRLARDCGATAHLGVLEADMVTYLVKIPAGAARGAASFTQESGQLEAYCSGLGKVLLAYLPPNEMHAYLAGSPFVALTPRTITEPRALEQALHTVRAEGFARDDGEIAEDLYCLAVPVRNRQREVVAAISLSFPRDGRSPDRDAGSLASLRTCAADISARLGLRP